MVSYFFSNLFFFDSLFYFREKDLVLSIIVPTYNSSRNISYLLESFSKQTSKNFEIIIVDDPRTSDQTDHIVKYYSGFFPVKFIKSSTIGNPGVSRNIGVLSVSSEIICFVDSDCVVEEHWVERICALWEKMGTNVGAIRGKVLPKVETFLTRILINGIYVSNIHLGATGNISYRRQVLIDAGLFDQKLTVNEDADLYDRVKKMGYKFIYSDEIVAFHDYKPGFKNFFNREIKFGGGFFLYWKKTHKIRTITPVIFGLSGFSLLFSSIFWGFYFFLFTFFLMFLVFVFLYRRYISTFIRHMSPVFLFPLFFVYVVKNVCNITGFFMALFRTKQN